MSEKSQVYEEYILSEKKEEFLKTLVKGSEDFNFLTMMHALTTKGVLKTGQIDLVPNKTYVNGKYLSWQEYKSILNELSSTGVNQKRRKEIIELLRDYYLRLQFNWGKPADIAQTKLVANNNSSIPTTLEVKQFDTIHYFESQMDYSSSYNIQKVRSESLNYLNFKKLLEKGNQDVISSFLQRIGFHTLSDSDAAALVYKFYNFHRSSYSYYELNDMSLYSRLTRTQLQYILKQHNSLLGKSIAGVGGREFMNALFQKIFYPQFEGLAGQSLNDLSTDQKRRKRDLLLQAQEWANQNVQKDISLQIYLYYEILVLDVMMEQPKEELFICYLENPKNFYSIPYVKEKREDFIKRNYDTDNYWASLKIFDQSN